MFLLLESKEEIARAQRKLEATIRGGFVTKAIKTIGYPGGRRLNVKVITDHHHWFWSKDLDGASKANPRKLNWFGLFREDADLQISVEINTPYKGRNDLVAGFFARESDTGAIYLMHSGRIGGAKKGVGKSTFLAWSDLRLIDVVDSTGDSRGGVLVMPIEGRAAIRPAIRYIDIVARFKQAVRAGETDTPELQHKEKLYRDFYSEPRGRRKGKRSSEIDYVSRHGDVLDALEAWRKSTKLEKGARLVKNVLFDLGVARGQELVEVYEIKTSTTRSHVYTGIGQLMVHGTTQKCRRVIVLEQKRPISADLKNGLKRLGIQLLKFRLDEVKATII
jgi:hypothetical protein